VVAGFVTGGVVAVAIVVVLMRFQNSAWGQIRQHRFFDDQPGTGLEATGEDQ